MLVLIPFSANFQCEEDKKQQKSLKSLKAIWLGLSKIYIKYTLKDKLGWLFPEFKTSDKTVIFPVLASLLIEMGLDGQLSPPALSLRSPWKPQT